METSLARSASTVVLRDTTGNRLVFVPLSNSDRRAIVDQKDYRRVVAQLGEASWHLGGDGVRQYVRAWDRKAQRPVSIARMIFGAEPRTSIGYRDGDTLNLRSGNLTIGFGCGGVAKRRRAQANALEKVR